MLDLVLSPSTELTGFRLVIVFTTPRHFVRSYASSSPVHFSSSHSLLSFSTFVLVFLYYRSLQVSKPSLSHFYLSSEHDRTTAYCLLQPSYLKTPLCPTCPSTPRCFFDSNSFTPHIARIIALFVLRIAMSFSLKHHASRPYNIADLT